MTIYDISAPHDLRGPMGKPSMTTDEIDYFLADPRADEDVKALVLLDVQPQGYRPEGRDWKVVLRAEGPDGTLRELEITVQATSVGLRDRINDIAPGAWREKFAEDPPANLFANYEPRL
jgi:hypothetical protein